MATAAVAAEFREYGHDLIREIDRQVLADVRGGQRGANDFITICHHDFRRAIRERTRSTRCGDHCSLAVGNREFYIVRQVL